MKRALALSALLLLLLGLTAHAALAPEAHILDVFGRQTDGDLDAALARLSPEELTLLSHKIQTLLEGEQEQAPGMVWIPQHGGTRYHNIRDCSNMADPRLVSVEEAESLGYTPCKRCGGTPK